MAEAIASQAPDNAHAYIISPQNGSTVSSPFTIQFGLSGMGIAPAGIDRSGTGHHHLLVDVETLPDLDQALSASEHIKHFGGGQTQVTKELPAGTHTLQLLLGDWTHVPHDPPVMSETITITVN